MEKQKIYVNKKEVNNINEKGILLEVLVDLFVYAVILMMASSIFKGFYIENIWYALLTSLIISILNSTIKPFLIYLTMPVTIVTLGLSYPIVNVIVLKLASWLLGNHFNVGGIIVPFFIAVFISFMKILLTNLVVNPLMKGRVK